ncbi:MAG TPA: amidase, partial [bacterium]|nr:amidase [bacterium]
MTVPELSWTSARDLAGLIRRGEVSPVDVVEAVLDRIDRINPAINAYCTVTAEQAREAARGAEQAVARGAVLGPLHGVPFSLKDLTPTRGIRTTMGSKIFEHQVPEEDAILVGRLRDAGAILLGKTNTPEFGCKPFTDNRIFGATRNPWARDRSAGGSSGGAAAAVAAGRPAHRAALGHAPPDVRVQLQRVPGHHGAVRFYGRGAAGGAPDRRGL